MRQWVARICLVISVFLPHSPASAEELALDKTEGAAPLTVCITGPKPLTDKIKECTFGQGFYGWSGNGIGLDWGDNNPNFYDDVQKHQGKSCAHLRCHTYPFPGTYDVKHQLWHPGPTDAPITDWEGTAQVVVSGQAPAAYLKITSPTTPVNLAFEKPAKLELRLLTGQPVDMVVQTLSADGKILNEEVKPKLTFAGNMTFSETYDPELEKTLKENYAGAYKLRVILRKGEEILASAESPTFTKGNQVGEVLHPTTDLQCPSMKSIADATFDTTNAPVGMGPTCLEYFKHLGRPPREVAFGQDKSVGQYGVRIIQPGQHKDCYFYKVNWGDATAEEEGKKLQDQCGLDGWFLELKHAYEKPGTYTIKLHFSEGPGTPAESYKLLQVDVK